VGIESRSVNFTGPHPFPAAAEYEILVAIAELQRWVVGIAEQLNNRGYVS